MFPKSRVGPVAGTAETGNRPLCQANWRNHEDGPTRAVRSAFFDGVTGTVVTLKGRDFERFWRHGASQASADAVGQFSDLGRADTDTLLQKYQDGDGRIAIPDVLRNYMGGATHLST